MHNMWLRGGGGSLRFGFLGQRIDCTVHWHLHTANPGGWGCYAHLSGRPFDPIHLSQPGKLVTPARRPSDPTLFLGVKPYNSVNTRKQIAHARTKRPQRTAQNLLQFLFFFCMFVCVVWEFCARSTFHLGRFGRPLAYASTHTHSSITVHMGAHIIYVTAQTDVQRVYASANTHTYTIYAHILTGAALAAGAACS